MKLIIILVAYGLLGISAKISWAGNIHPSEKKIMAKVKNITTSGNYMQWGPWTKISCYRGIEFRTRRGEYYMGTYSWNVQFRNLYSKEVRFGYNIVEPEKEAITRQERNVLDVWRLAANFDPDEEGNNRDAAHGSNNTTSADKVFVYITNLQFSDNGSWDTPLIKCDY